MKKRNKNITIKDIARELGVSIAMVSIVLSGKSNKYRISDIATKRVFETAKRLGYTPNYLAQSLRTGRTNILGLIVADIANPFYSKLAREIENEAGKLDYHVMFSSSDESLEKLRKLGIAFVNRQVDGLIITPVMESKDFFKKFHSYGVPIVFVDRYFDLLNIPYAVTDNFDASIQILKYIREKGYKKIAFITKESNLSSFVDREAGFLSGIKNLNLNPQEYKIFKMNYNIWESELDIILQDILNGGYDIIYFAQNMIALKGLSVMNSLKVNIPEDIAVISFDNPDVFQFFKPPITCFEQPLEELAKASITCMFQLINNENCDEGNTCRRLKGKLIVRESC